MPATSAQSAHATPDQGPSSVKLAIGGSSAPERDAR